MAQLNAGAPTGLSQKCHILVKFVYLKCLAQIGFSQGVAALPDAQLRAGAAGWDSGRLLPGGLLGRDPSLSGGALPNARARVGPLGRVRAGCSGAHGCARLCGRSSFERLPVEQAIVGVVKDFKKVRVHATSKSAAR